MRKKTVLFLFLGVTLMFSGWASLNAHEKGERFRFNLGMEVGSSFSKGYMGDRYNKSFWGLNISAEFGSRSNALNVRAGLGIHHILGSAIDWASLNYLHPWITPENILPSYVKEWTEHSRIDSFCFRLGAVWYPIKGNHSFYLGGGGTLAENEEAYKSGASIYYSDGTNNAGYANGIWSGGVGAHFFTGYTLGRVSLELLYEIVPFGWGTPTVSLGLLTLGINYRI